MGCLTGFSAVEPDGARRGTRVAEPRVAPISVPKTARLCIVFVSFTLLRHNLKAHHHGVVLMHDVVAVQGVVAEEVSQLVEDLALAGILGPYGAVSYPYDILSGLLIAGNRFAISRQDLEFFKVEMDGVLPAVPAGEGPELRGILAWERS